MATESAKSVNASSELIAEGIRLLGERRVSEAVEKLGLAKDAAVSAGDRLGQARALGNLANAHATMAQHAEAVDTYEQSLAIFTEIGDTRRQSTLLGNMARSLVKLEKLDEAEAVLHRKVELTKESDPAACREAEASLQFIQRQLRHSEDRPRSGSGTAFGAFAAVAGALSDALAAAASGDDRPEVHSDHGSDAASTTSSVGPAGAGAGAGAGSGSVGIPDSASVGGSVGVAPPAAPGAPVGAPMSASANLMEFDFDNLPFDDALQRAARSMATLDQVVQFLRGRAAAESRYANSIRELSTVGGSKMAIFGSRQRTTEHGTLEAAMVACRKGMAEAATVRQQVATHLEGMVSRLLEVKAKHTALNKTLTSDAKNATKQVRAVGRALSKASTRLDKARGKETKCFRNVKATSMDDPKRQRRLDDLNSARSEVDSAEAHLRKVASDLIIARNNRDERLAQIAGVLQEYEVDRLSSIAKVLDCTAQSDAGSLSAQFTAQAAVGQAVTDIDPLTDIRMFIHRQRVAHMLEYKRQQLRQAAEKARQRVAEEAAAAAGLPPPPAPKMKRIINDADDEGLRVVPRNLSAAERQKQSTSHLRQMRDLTPVVDRWLTAIFAGTGSETARAAAVDSTEGDASAAGSPAEVAAGTTADTGADGSMGAGAGSDGAGGAEADTEGADGGDGGGDDGEVGGDAEDASGGDGGAADTTDELDAATGTSSAEGESAGADGDTTGDESGPTAEIDETKGGEGEVFDVDAILSTLAGRLLFLRSLNQQRTKQQNIGPQYDRLRDVMSRFLDHCLTAHDVDSAKMMMIMSETFYRPAAGAETPDDGEDVAPSGREFIQTSLVGHDMWRNAHFWEEAFYRSVREEVKKAYGRQLAAAQDGSEGATLPAMLQPDSKEWAYMYQQIVFGQLGSYAMNMRVFGMPDDAVNRVVRRLGDGNGVSKELMEMLFTNAAQETQR